jgi:hypothetical protein
MRQDCRITAGGEDRQSRYRDRSALPGILFILSILSILSILQSCNPV